MRRHVLTTLEGDVDLSCGNLGLGSWWDDVKSWTSSNIGDNISTGISVLSKSGIPGLQQAAQLTRTANQIAEQTGIYDGLNLTTKSSAPAPATPYAQSAAPAGYTYNQAGQLVKSQDNTVLYVVGAAVLAVLLLKK